MSIAQASAARKAGGQVGRGAGPGRMHAPLPARVLVLVAVVALHVFVYSMLRTPVGGLIVERVAESCCLVFVPLERRAQTPLPPVEAARERPPTPRAITTPLVPQPAELPVPYPAADAPRSAAPLDLRLPRTGLDDELQPVNPGAGWVFDRKLARKLDEARARAHARQRLAGRRAAREGVSEDDYARNSALGDKVKTDAGCFDLREDSDTGHTRWWREACTDSREDAWAQAPFDEEE